jgi:putative radical SAM enzyme (TIGR03279 family)
MKNESLHIIAVNDPALYGLDEGTFEIGDEVVEVDGHPIRDQLDFHFFSASDESPRLTLRKKTGELRVVEIDAETLDEMDIRFEPMIFKECRCRCPFCFVDQMPPGLRPALYVKDEDYRLSFLYGNYTTMNDITDGDIDKIVTQNLQPQFVSVHALEPDVREAVFGRPMKRDIAKTLKTLARNGIAIHAQVVLCPGINDGIHLERTIEGLEALDPLVESLSIVPVGLTRHRKGLPAIRRFHASEHAGVIGLVERYQERFLGGPRRSRFVFASDEWYVASGRELPPYESYEQFQQIDNGVGMTRSLVREVEEELPDAELPPTLGRIGIVTGVLGSRVFEEYVFPLFERAGIAELPQILAVENRFFGETVTVAGLLTAEDIIARLKNAEDETLCLLPPNCLNFEGRFIDGPDVDHVRSASGRSVSAPERSLVRSIVECLQDRERAA